MRVKCGCGAEVEIRGTRHRWSEQWLGVSKFLCRQMKAIEERGETVPEDFRCPDMDRNIEIAWRQPGRR